jgi:hypothetical protein
VSKIYKHVSCLALTCDMFAHCCCDVCCCRWGVPPEVDLLSAAIQQGGGIVETVYKQ